MGLITRDYEYVAGNTIDPAENNANENKLFNEINGNIDNANIKSDAGIVESKLAFSTSTGHDHDGVNSKLIPRTILDTVIGTLTVNTDPSPWIIASQAMTISKVYGIVKTAPTGASILIDIEKSTDNGATWTSIWNTTPGNRLTIAAGSRNGSQTSFDTTAVAEGNLLRIAVDQVGSTVPGANLTVAIKA